MHFLSWVNRMHLVQWHGFFSCIFHDSTQFKICVNNWFQIRILSVLFQFDFLFRHNVECFFYLMWIELCIMTFSNDLKIFSQSILTRFDRKLTYANFILTELSITTFSFLSQWRMNEWLQLIFNFKWDNVDQILRHLLISNVSWLSLISSEF